jgi:hypothetical protein
MIAQHTGDNSLVRAFAILILACVLCAAVIYGIHALEQHGADAQAVRRCMDERGPLAIWQQPDGCTTHNLVTLDDGRTGDQIRIEAQNGKEYEKTSFIPRNGNLERIIEWLVKKGCTQCAPK